MRSLILLLGLLLCAPTAAGLQKSARRRPTQRPTNRAAYLPEGHYFELSPCLRCYRCAPCAIPDRWQKEILTDLRENKINAALTNPNSILHAEKGVRKLTGIRGYYTNIYIGPYESEEVAKQAFKHLCEIASDFDECRDWPDKEYMIAFSNGIWVTLTYVASPGK